MYLCVLIYHMLNLIWLECCRFVLCRDSVFVPHREVEMTETGGLDCDNICVLACIASRVENH